MTPSMYNVPSTYIGTGVKVYLDLSTCNKRSDNATVRFGWLTTVLDKIRVGNAAAGCDSINSLYSLEKRDTWTKP